MQHRKEASESETTTNRSSGVFKPLTTQTHTPIIDAYARDNSSGAPGPIPSMGLGSTNHDASAGPTLTAGANAFTVTVTTDANVDPTDTDLAVNVSVFMFDMTTLAYDIPVVSTVPGTLQLTAGQNTQVLPDGGTWFVTDDFTATGNALAAGQYRVVVHRHEPSGNTPDEPSHFANFTVVS